MLSVKLVQNLSLAKFAQKYVPVRSLHRKLDVRTNFIKSKNGLDLENWMGNLRPDLKSIPVINLAIPGSHDSMTFGINEKSQIGPDADPAIAILFKKFPDICRNWAKCQELTALEQLQNGIRYFDLRIALNKNDNEFYYTHTLYADKITAPLEQINKFLDNHPNEFVILDCQHMYQMEKPDYIRLADLMKKIFEEKLISPTDGVLSSFTLENFKSAKKQVLIVFRNNTYIPVEFWPNEACQTLWPNTIQIGILKFFLDTLLKDRPKNAVHVTQCILTPTLEYIIENFYDTLKNTLATKVVQEMTEWISNQKAGIYNVADIPTRNVFIANFINLSDYKFVKTVVDLNNKIPNYKPLLKKYL